MKLNCQNRSKTVILKAASSPRKETVKTIMCGRFEINSAIELIAKVFGLIPKDITIQFRPNYNVAPTNDVLVIVRNGKRRLEQYRWGLIPSWAKEEKIGLSMINARAETVAEKPAFRDAFKKQRCLVIADGFYEWQAVGKVKKPVLYI